MPVFFVNTDIASKFWVQNWYIMVSFLAILGILDAYFIKNWKLFSLIEQENWNGLLTLLNSKLSSNKKLTKRELQILSNTALVTQNYNTFQTIENYILKYNSNFDQVRLYIAIAYILEGNQERTVNFFQKHEPLLKNKNFDWFLFFKSFTFIKEQNRDLALETMNKTLSITKDPLLLLGLVYLMKDLSENEILKAHKLSITEKYGKAQLRTMIEKRKEDLQVVVISKLLYDSLESLYAIDLNASANS